MKVILNYKSFYDAFKLGMVDDGFTPVAKILFHPLFSSHTILDENGIPYEVDAQNASRWGNGQIPIQKEIQDAAGTNDTLTKMITYFNDKVVPIELSEALMDEMLEAMVELVNDCDLSDSKKKQFLKYYEKGEVGEFLARVFQRALLGKNKVTSSRRKISASENNVDSANEFNALVRGKLKKPKTTVPKKIQAHELGYVSQLYRAYGQTKSVSVNKPEDLVPLDLSEHFEMQRKHYYLAETIHRKLRDSIKRDEDDCFDILKDEIETGIYKASHTQYASPVERIDAVTERASDVIISPNTEQIMYNWIGPGEKLVEKKREIMAQKEDVQMTIRGELRPKVDSLRDRLSDFTAALEHAKAAELVDSFVSILKEKMDEVIDDGDGSENAFDIRSKVKEVFTKLIDEKLTAILKSCNYENFVGARFDIESCDVVVNGSEKMTQGQGFRAFLNAVMAIVIQECLEDYNKHLLPLMLIDSPIMSLKEREENVGTEVTTNSMRSGLFNYMIQNCACRQTIILENEIPNLKYDGVNLIHFTKRENDGIYGLIKEYRE